MYTLNSKFVETFTTGPGTFFHEHQEKIKNFAQTSENLISCIFVNELSLKDGLFMLGNYFDYALCAASQELRPFIDKWSRDITRTFISVKAREKDLPEFLLLEMQDDSMYLIMQIFSNISNASPNCSFTPGDYSILWWKEKGCTYHSLLQMISKDDKDKLSYILYEDCNLFHFHRMVPYRNIFLVDSCNLDLVRYYIGSNNIFENSRISKKIKISHSLFRNYSVNPFNILDVEQMQEEITVKEIEKIKSEMEKED